MALSVTNLKVGRKYTLINDGEVHKFEIVSRIDDYNYMVKDLLTYEVFELFELLKYGRSKDYDIIEHI